MDRWTASAAGGISQRAYLIGATVLSRSSSPTLTVPPFGRLIDRIPAHAREHSRERRAALRAAPGETPGGTSPGETMKSSLEIAQDATLQPIETIAERTGLQPEEFEPYGRYKAK